MYWNTIPVIWPLCLSRLTLTWDVLKSVEDGEDVYKIPININMRCIEIDTLLQLFVPQYD